MALATTQAVWRSGGGDQTRTAYCGSMMMVATFYIASVAQAATTKVKISSASNAPQLILPAGAIIQQIYINQTYAGGTNPTIDMGFTLYNSGTNTPGALLDNYPGATGKTVADWATATAGTSLNAVMSASQMVYITAGTGSGTAGTGTATGTIVYYIADDGQQNV